MFRATVRKAGGEPARALTVGDSITDIRTTPSPICVELHLIETACILHNMRYTSYYTCPV
jgi:hypothetical protein